MEARCGLCGLCGLILGLVGSLDCALFCSAWQDLALVSCNKLLHTDTGKACVARVREVRRELPSPLAVLKDCKLSVHCK